MEKSDGLSWSDLSAEMDLPWQFGPGCLFDIDSQNKATEEYPIPTLGDAANLKNCKKASDTELEWQWILDHQQTFESEWSSSNILDDYKTIDNSSNGTDLEQDLKGEARSSVVTSSLFRISKTKGSSDAGTSNASKVTGNLSVELSTSKSSYRDSSSWHTADSKELAALVLQKNHGYLENCDLPPLQNSLTCRGPLASIDLTSSKYLKAGASSAKIPFLASVSEPQSVPSAALKSPDNQPMSWNIYGGQHAGVTQKGFEALGEALCHSQTRARRAENLATQALQEQEKFVRLLFKESWTARTYKQWVQTLELENRWLKICSGSDIEVWTGKGLSNISGAIGQTIANPWKNCGKGTSQKKMDCRWHCKQRKHGSVTESSVWLCCTIGLAFALGISFAGAGLMIGWSMGWILLSY